MKKRRLEVEFAYDFELMGLISSARGYKLAWEINHSLAVNLVRKEDLKMTTKEGEYFFNFYSHQSSVNTVNLFRNRSNEVETKAIFLVPNILTWTIYFTPGATKKCTANDCRKSCAIFLPWNWLLFYLWPP